VFPVTRVTLARYGMHRLPFLMVAYLAIGLAQATPSASAAELPDLAQLPPYHVGVEHRDGRWYLGFSTGVRNDGPAALRLRGHGSGNGTMAAEQLSEDGTEVLQPDAGSLHYVTTYGHRHWHYMGFMRYELRGLDRPGALLDHKQGFCLFEAPFVDGWCARDKPTLATTDVGMDPGTVDIYTPHVEGQEIEIAPDTAPSGRYVLTSRIGPTGRLAETRTDNNVASTVIQLRWPVRDAQPIAAIRTCVGEGCAGALPPVPRTPRWLRTSVARRLARKALRRTIGRLPARARVRCQRARTRGNVCRVLVERRILSFRGTVRLRYEVVGAATRWRYTVKLVRRVRGCSRAKCVRRIRRTDRLGGAVPAGRATAFVASAPRSRLVCRLPR
jgi:hypothetical protein